MAEKKVIDWDVIEPEWRAGIKSKLQLSEEFGVSRAAIDKHFAKAGITRDLSEKIRDKADALVTQDAVTREVTSETKIQEKEVIEANAVLQATIRREQRKDIQRSRKLVMSLLSELECQTDNMDLLERLGELVIDLGLEATEKQREAQYKRQEAFEKVISLNSRTGTMKSLAESLKSLVALERQAFSIDGGSGDDPEKPSLPGDSMDAARRIAFILAQAVNKGPA